MRALSSGSLPQADGNATLGGSLRRPRMSRRRAFLLKSSSLAAVFTLRFWVRLSLLVENPLCNKTNYYHHVVCKCIGIHDFCVSLVLLTCCLGFPPNFETISSRLFLPTLLDLDLFSLPSPDWRGLPWCKRVPEALNRSPIIRP